ncbi:hypothetical protein ACSBM8_05015 [Sphingomonas sp. ASY06-1R]|uniref:hypothetical protein n=1 Tax=Sphingomonas sp. ASY06-1R TaxID=3445771 RepID=UPI003FA2A435
MTITSKTPLSAVALGLAVASPVPAQAPAAPTMQVPSAGQQRPPEEQLAPQAGNLLDLIARPDPHYATFTLLAPDVRLWIVGPEKSRMVEGPAVREALTAIFRQPDDDHWFVHDAAKVQRDGSFGRFTIVANGRERGRSFGGCLVLYGDAILQGTEWSVVNLTVTRRRSDCDGG